MNKKDADAIIIVGVGAIALYFLLRNRNQNSALQDTPSVDNGNAPDTPPIYNDPIELTYAANPSAFQPSGLDGIDVSVNINGPNSLAGQYFPLFGFVGMAQGALY